MILDGNNNILSSLSHVENAVTRDLIFKERSPSLIEKRNTYNSTCRTSLDCQNDSCTCAHGFSGNDCDIPPSVCKSGICRNSGKCIATKNNTFYCVCPDSFIGKFCEKALGCSKFAHQNDTIISCYGDDEHKICEVKCGRGRVRSDKYMHETYYECGTKTERRWVLSRNQQVLEENEMPVCADTASPESLIVNLEVAFRGIKCEDIQPSACNGSCVVNVTVKECKNIGDSVQRAYLVKTHLQSGGQPLQLGAYHQKGIVSEPLKHLVQAFYVTESKLVDLEYVDAKNASHRKRRSRRNTETNLHKEYLLLRRYYQVLKGSHMISKRSLIETKIHGYVSLLNAEVKCTAGSFLQGDSCVYCPVGTYQEGNGCAMCKSGFYQNDVGQTSCKFCPPGHLSFVGSESVEKCFDRLKPAEDDEIDIDTIIGIIGAILAVFGLLIGLYQIRQARHKKYDIRGNME